MCEMGWTGMSTPAAPDYRAFYSRSVSSFTNVTDAMYVGADEPPATITAEQTIALCPRVSPLSKSHMLPAGIIWDAKIGSRFSTFSEGIAPGLHRGGERGFAIG